jgi:hypothetical protein
MIIESEFGGFCQRLLEDKEFLLMELEIHRQIFFFALRPFVHQIKVFWL